MLGVLIILDGWGVGPDNSGNAISQAKTPNLDALRQKYSYTTLSASGEAVGLPKGQDGNSEAGHMNIGAGRVVEQEALIINKKIESGVFFKNPAFNEAVNHAQYHKSKLHLMGLLTNHMSGHASPDHLIALLKFCKEKKIKPYLHLFTDGRDAPPHAAVNFLKNLQDNFLDGEVIATIMGRFYAMERNKRWSITEQAYNALVLGEGERAQSAEEAIVRSYNRDESDEFIKPHVIDDSGMIDENDSIIFFNFRSDRTRQISKAFVQKDFNKCNPGSFRRKKKLQHIKFISMTDFGPDLDHIISAFPAIDIKYTLPFALEGHRQLYIAESEKYAHVTYFFNGGYDEPVDGETWYKVQSPENSDYIVSPEMCATKITNYVVDAIKQDAYDFFVINFANADMLGHSGDINATIKAVEEVDKQIGILCKEIEQRDGVMFITADHGNAEEMLNIKTNETDTEHSIYPVPFIVTKKNCKLKAGGKLANISPTILKVLEIEQPKEMTAEPLC
ncbi:MAG: 2,3-bisphosphoglycerate-independent phosphoglycerate mutase [bacterium]|nr:2,3-bisphosphoglycerate-independent phosphoglycerate mutase [bacterium]